MRTLGSVAVIILAGLLVPGQAFAQSECENTCEDCVHKPEWWFNLGFGIGSYMTWMEPTGYCTDPWSCVPGLECRGPEEEDSKPQEVLDAELDQLLALERDQVPDWVRVNRQDFQLNVVDGTLQVASRCGGLITWVALDPSQVATTRALLEE